MPACAACGRPVAMARPRCLYCGAALDAAAVAAAEEARAAVESSTAVPRPAAGPAAAEAEPAPSDRVLVIVETSGAPEVLASALSLSLYDARQRAVRGGIVVHRVADAATAAAEAARLRAAGLAATEVPEEEVRRRSQARVAIKGSPEGGRLRLATADEVVDLAPGDVFLVVKGPIAREYPPSDAVKRVRLAGLEPGYRFHLHRRGDERPLELDPANFEFGRAAAGSSILTLAGWVEGLRAPAQDDTFRNATPAMAPAAPEPGATSTASALGGRPATPIHDNLAQFRRHSACHAAVAERRPR